MQALNRKTNRIEKPQLMLMFSRAWVTSITSFSSKCWG